MKILIVSYNGLWDACFPLIESLKDKCDLYCALELIPEHPNFLGIKPADFIDDSILEGKRIIGLEKYSKIIPIDHTVIIQKHVPRNIARFLIDSIVEKRYIESVKPDFVYFFHDPIYSLSFIKHTTIPWGIAVHDPLPHNGGRMAINLLRRYIFKKCDNFFLFSQNLIPEFKKVYGLNDSQIHNTQLGIYSHLSTLYGFPVEKAQESNNSLKILFFGKILPYKGLPLLLRAFKCLREKNMNVELTIAGKGYVDSDIISLTSANGIFLDNDYIDEPQLAEYIKNSDIVICPYEEATQSGVIMTSYAFCKPVIATRVGGLTEMVKDGMTGTIIEPSNVDAIVEALEDVYYHRDLLSEWAGNIYSLYYEGVQGRTKIATKLLKDIESIINNAE